MDSNIKLLHTFPSHVPLPYYMDYPGYQGAKKEQEILRDMEYLQQVYPGEVKHYQKRIAQILDKMDYEGSMIYDEYPDFTSIRSMTDSIVRILRNEEQTQPENGAEDPNRPENLNGAEDSNRPDTAEGSEEKWNWIGNMIQVLLCDEIYKRRHGGKRGKIFWMN